MLKKIISGCARLLLACCCALKTAAATALAALPFCFYRSSAAHGIMEKDLARWGAVLGIDSPAAFRGFSRIFIRHPEFRNLFYYRLGDYSALLKWLFPPMQTLYISTATIGPGLFIQHGFSTIISAASIGENCWINQQVTIGFTNVSDCPVIKDNVSIYAGAKVLGNITVGSNVKVGANAVVLKDVPDNCTVAGVPARIVTKNNQSRFRD